MRRAIPFVVLALAGCSTAPIADFMDAVWPAPTDLRGPTYGGVALPPVEVGPGVTFPPPEPVGEPFPPISRRTDPQPSPPLPSAPAIRSSR